MPIANMMRRIPHGVCPLVVGMLLGAAYGIGVSTLWRAATRGRDHPDGNSKARFLLFLVLYSRQLKLLLRAIAKPECRGVDELCDRGRREPSVALPCAEDTWHAHCVMYRTRHLVLKCTSSWTRGSMHRS